MTVKLTLALNKASRESELIIGGYATSFPEAGCRFLFPLNYLMACPWIYMTAPKSAGNVEQQRSQWDPSDLAPLAHPGDAHIYILPLSCITTVYKM